MALELAVARASPRVSGRLQWGSFWVRAWGEPLCCVRISVVYWNWGGMDDGWVLSWFKPSQRLSPSRLLAASSAVGWGRIGNVRELVD